MDEPQTAGPTPEQYQAAVQTAINHRFDQAELGFSHGHALDYHREAEAMMGEGTWLCLACLFERAWFFGYELGLKDKHGHHFLYIRAE